MGDPSSHGRLCLLLAAWATSVRGQMVVYVADLGTENDGSTSVIYSVTMDGSKVNGPWMDTLEADWMLPSEDQLTLPDNIQIPSNAIELTEEGLESEVPAYLPTWLETTDEQKETLPLRQSPSSLPPVEGASVGEIIELGERLSITGSYEPATLGSALHAAIASKILG